MTLTKQEAIEGHRKMWNWIADRLEKATPRDTFDVYNLKMEYEELHNLKLFCSCYLCEYARKKSLDEDIDLYKRCVYCPLLWEENKSNTDFICEYGNGIEQYDDDIIDVLKTFHSDVMGDFGLWNVCDFLAEKRHYDKAARLARKIANLPEKDEIEISREK